MFLIDQLILAAAVLLLIGTLSSKLSARLGLPVLVVFVGVGMLAGEDGPGRIDFDNFALAHAIGTLALAIILFDGGLQTRAGALRAVWKPALLLATLGVLVVLGVLIVVARPVAVMPLLMLFGFTVREQVLIAWVGLKGAVPIILATFPLLVDVPGGLMIFNVVFFVVLVSATLQGWTLPLVASRLGLEAVESPPPAAALELLALRDLDAEVVDFAVSTGSPIAGLTLGDLNLPDGAVVAMVSRGAELVTPRGGTRLEAGDHLFVITITRTAVRDEIEGRLQGRAPASDHTRRPSTDGE